MSYGNELIINLSNGQKLVCTKYEGGQFYPEELSVYIADKDGNPIQDICLVRESFKTDISQSTSCWISNQDKVEVLVWADDSDDDYSNKFVIEQREDEN